MSPSESKVCAKLGADLVDAGLQNVTGLNSTLVASAICGYVGDHFDRYIGPSINVSFILFSAYLVFFMQAGFAMLCAGSVRQKNTINILLKNLLDACVGCIAWYFFGFAFAYGEGTSNGFIGSDGFALHDYNNYGYWLFQWTFAATAATIVSGAMAERSSFVSYLGYAFMLSAFVYPVAVHWVWSPSGWLSYSGKSPTDPTFGGVGAIDYSGCGVVHLVGGSAALWGAYLVGPRIGRFDANGAALEIRGHSASLVVLGTFLLWFGWYGFNPGSAISIVGMEHVVERIAVVTTIGAASGGLSALFLKRLISATWDVMSVCNGTLGGLISVTAGCAVIEPWEAFVIGSMAGPVYLLASWLLLKAMIDDPVDAAPLHGGCGTWGLVAVGLFAGKEKMVTSLAPREQVKYYGAFHGGGGRLLGVQLLYVVVIIGWVTLTIGPFFAVLSYMGILRVPVDVETSGQDMTKHGGPAYHVGGARSMTVQMEPLLRALKGGSVSWRASLRSPLSMLKKKNSDIRIEDSEASGKNGGKEIIGQDKQGVKTINAALGIAAVRFQEGNTSEAV
ncbi:hypothetical protein CBR_g40726 [Chara braunii]|uniref:Ammonium transporter n=1 Tax=Chara braunii TaxID=69332 RepID=A0A388LUB7_CHABU|nr:hypothetical protein CBR_g40726 [Chara braunii]|eukprot:GBG85914.1 hypothetical protein CBR_g40726 [Chara braunii]